jgi:hypothetical protein
MDAGDGGGERRTAHLTPSGMDLLYSALQPNWGAHWVTQPGLFGPLELHCFSCTQLSTWAPVCGFGQTIPGGVALEPLACRAMSPPASNPK